MKNCTHTWVNKGFGDDYCSKCNITKEQLALGLNAIVKEPEVAVKTVEEAAKVTEVEVKEPKVEVKEPEVAVKTVEEAAKVTEVEVKEPKVEVKEPEVAVKTVEEAAKVTLADIYPAKTVKVGKK